MLKVIEVVTTSLPLSRLKGPARVFAWITQIVAAGILAQTLFFKFTGAPESMFIFSTLGVEPWGRWLTGIAELVAVVLLLTPAVAVLGSFLGAALMFGALVSHLLLLGIVVQDDGGLLFLLATVTFVACCINVYLRQAQAAAVATAAKQQLFG
jgi:hypothetical protein